LSCLAIAAVLKVFREVELSQDLELELDNQLAEAFLVQEANEY